MLDKNQKDFDYNCPHCSFRIEGLQVENNQWLSVECPWCKKTFRIRRTVSSASTARTTLLTQ
jgi:nitrite reductase/ring-hydroxylating ferredoxin subunit